MTALLLNLSYGPEPTRETILKLLLKGAQELGSVVRQNILDLQKELQTLKAATPGLCYFFLLKSNQYCNSVDTHCHFFYTLFDVNVRMLGLRNDFVLLKASNNSCVTFFYIQS